MEDACPAEAAVAGRGVHPDLDLVRRGPTEVRQNRLVSFALRVVALVLTAALLWDNHRLLSSTQALLERITQHNIDIFPSGKMSCRYSLPLQSRKRLAG